MVSASVRRRGTCEEMATCSSQPPLQGQYLHNHVHANLIGQMSNIGISFRATSWVDSILASIDVFVVLHPA